jgi:hypothetical protein
MKPGKASHDASAVHHLGDVIVHPGSDHVIYLRSGECCADPDLALVGELCIVRHRRANVYAGNPVPDYAQVENPVMKPENKAALESLEGCGCMLMIAAFGAIAMKIIEVAQPAVDAITANISLWFSSQMNGGRLGDQLFAIILAAGFVGLLIHIYTHIKLTTMSEGNDETATMADPS